VILCVFVGIIIGAPIKPTISEQFRADVAVRITDKDGIWSGGGLYAFDTVKGEARTDYKFYNEKNQPKIIHVLERYDQHAVYLIEDFMCTKQAVTGSIPAPWGWLATATYFGSSTYRGKDLDVWQYVDETVTKTLYVYSSEPNIPVFVEEATVIPKQNITTHTHITFDYFDASTPEEWVFYVPLMCENATARAAGVDRLGGDANSVVYFANANWNCANVACTSRVAAGSGQPGYECAEFVSRSLAYGSYIAGLSSTASQATYGSWKGYNLLLCTSLSSFLGSIGFKKQANAQTSVHPATAIFGDGGEGSFSHACIGVGTGTVDCHNNARNGNTASGIMYKGIDAVWSP